jgi:hypothetical protein
MLQHPGCFPPSAPCIHVCSSTCLVLLFEERPKPCGLCLHLLWRARLAILVRIDTELFKAALMGRRNAPDAFFLVLFESRVNVVVLVACEFVARVATRHEMEVHMRDALPSRSAVLWCGESLASVTIVGDTKAAQGPTWHAMVSADAPYARSSTRPTRCTESMSPPSSAGERSATRGTTRVGITSTSVGVQTFMHVGEGWSDKPARSAYVRARAV